MSYNKYSEELPHRSKKSVLVKTLKNTKANLISARVTAIISKSIYVKTDDNQEYEAILRGVINSTNRESSLIAVGDYVKVIQSENHQKQSHLPLCTIEQIEERTTSLSRKSSGYEPFEQIIASNITDVMILVATANPDYNLKLIDRIVISAELNNLNPIICVNKIDLIDYDEIYEDFRIYQEQGIEVYFVSIRNKINLQALLEALKGKEVALIGQSGVGKSTLVNLLFASELQKTNEISTFNFKGKHTTSFVKMFDYNFDNKIKFKIVDSPGIKEFGIWGLEKSDLPFYFKEFGEYATTCKYQPCTHTHEPGCAVIQAVEDGKILPVRYQSYLNILDSLE